MDCVREYGLNKLSRHQPFFILFCMFAPESVGSMFLRNESFGSLCHLVQKVTPPEYLKTSERAEYRADF